MEQERKQIIEVVSEIRKSIDGQDVGDGEFSYLVYETMAHRAEVPFVPIKDGDLNTMPDPNDPRTKKIKETLTKYSSDINP
jgi:hypothetical protein